MPPKFTTIGTTLQGKTGEYVIKDELARGGMGAIYRAEDLKRDGVVAVKEACLDPVACEGRRDIIRERLLHEMEVLIPLNHPNIPKIYDQFSSENNEYLVMDFVLLSAGRAPAAALGRSYVAGVHQRYQRPPIFAQSQFHRLQAHRTSHLQVNGDRS